MATYTEHYNLLKPDTEDFYDISDFNENMDLLDTQLMQMEAEAESTGSAVAEVSQKIGTAADEGSDTLFGLVKQGAQTPLYYFSTEEKEVILNEELTTNYNDFLLVGRWRADRNGMITIRFRMRVDGSGSGALYMLCFSGSQKMDNCDSTAVETKYLNMPVGSVYKSGTAYHEDGILFYDALSAKTYTDFARTVFVTRGQELFFALNVTSSATTGGKCDHIAICYSDTPQEIV